MQDSLVNLIKHQKVFAGPHFCITEPCLIMVTKVGVLQKLAVSAKDLMQSNS
jgi:hypothetical protein